MPEHIEDVLGAPDTPRDYPAPRPVPREPEIYLPSASASGEHVRTMPGWEPTETGARERQKRGWGPKYQPPIEQAEERRRYRRICDDLDAEVRQLEQFVVGGVVSDEAVGLVAEIQNLLETLYDCPFGEGESLKSVVVAIQSQLNNAAWSEQHLAFLRGAIQHLRVRPIVNDCTAQEIHDMIEEHGLDPFRGTVSDSDCVVTYKLQRVEDA